MLNAADWKKCSAINDAGLCRNGFMVTPGCQTGTNYPGNLGPVCVEEDWTFLLYGERPKTLAEQGRE